MSMHDILEHTLYRDVFDFRQRLPLHCPSFKEGSKCKCNTFDIQIYEIHNQNETKNVNMCWVSMWRGDVDLLSKDVLCVVASTLPPRV